MSVRPVVSMVGTPEYQLAKILVNIIEPYIPGTYLFNYLDTVFTDVLYLLRSTEHFINEV